MSEALYDYCRSLLEGGSLEEKLRPPSTELVDEEHRPLFIDAPARTSALRMRPEGEKLPKLSALTEGEARVRCLSRFAHHELQAVELFAWALLAYPELPSALRRGFLQTLIEEQEHLRLYLDRMQAHGASLGDLPLSDYFWRHLPTKARSEEGPLAFLCAMGLTLEQANLDFSILYRDAFARAGDDESARALQRVHDDEVGHVRLAAVWLRKLKDPSESEIEAYERVIPFPLSAARAKGRRFERKARERAGLSEAFIDYVQGARPYERRR